MPNKIFTFTISTEAARKQMAGFLDMLRYDAALVVAHDRTLTVLQTKNQEPTRARWQSMGLGLWSMIPGDCVGTAQAEARQRMPEYLVVEDERVVCSGCGTEMYMTEARIPALNGRPGVYYCGWC